MLLGRLPLLPCVFMFYYLYISDYALMLVSEFPAGDTLLPRNVFAVVLETKPPRNEPTILSKHRCCHRRCGHQQSKRSKIVKDATVIFKHEISIRSVYCTNRHYAVCCIGLQILSVVMSCTTSDWQSLHVTTLNSWGGGRDQLYRDNTYITFL